MADNDKFGELAKALPNPTNKLDKQEKDDRDKVDMLGDAIFIFFAISKILDNLNDQYKSNVPLAFYNNQVRITIAILVSLSKFLVSQKKLHKFSNDVGNTVVPALAFALAVACTLNKLAPSLNAPTNAAISLLLGCILEWQREIYQKKVDTKVKGIENYYNYATVIADPSADRKTSAKEIQKLRAAKAQAQNFDLVIDAVRNMVEIFALSTVTLYFFTNKFSMQNVMINTVFWTALKYVVDAALWAKSDPEKSLDIIGCQVRNAIERTSGDEIAQEKLLRLRDMINAVENHPDFLSGKMDRAVAAKELLEQLHIIIVASDFEQHKVKKKSSVAKKDQNGKEQVGADGKPIYEYIYGPEQEVSSELIDIKRNIVKCFYSIHDTIKSNDNYINPGHMVGTLIRASGYNAAASSLLSEVAEFHGAGVGR